MVYTTPLNKRATCASALPTANSLWLGSHRGPRYRGSETDIITSNIYRSMTNINFLSKRLSSVRRVLSTMTREWFGNGSVYSRLSLGSHLSRFSLVSLICLCMLTIGVGNVWGTDVTINFGTTTGYWAAHTDNSYTDSDSRSWSRTYSAGDKSSGQESYSQFGNKDNSCTSLILTATAGKAMTVTAFSVTMAGGSTSTAGTIYLYKRTSGGTETKLATQSLSGSSNVTCSISSNATFTSTDILKVSYVGTAKSIQIKTLSYSYSTGGGSKYTVSFNTGTGNPSQADVTEVSSGAGITLPNVTPNCSDDGWALYGWATSACSSETAVAPSIVGKAGDIYNPTANTTLYAVYAKGEYTKETSSIISGSRYLIVASSGGHNHIMKSSSDDFRDYSGYHGMAAIQIDETYTGKYHASSINPSWCYSIEGTAGNYFIRDVVNNSNSNYADIAYGEWWGHAIDNDDKYTITVSSGIWTIQNNYYNRGYSYLGYDSSDDAFFAFGSAKEILLYRDGTIAYFSNPSCAACTADPTIGTASLKGSIKRVD